MHPYIVQSLAQAHIDDLHRDASQRRRASAIEHPRIQALLEQRLATLRTNADAWLAVHPQHLGDDPACCPA
jgi:hypothetical protein